MCGTGFKLADLTKVLLDCIVLMYVESLHLMSTHMQNTQDIRAAFMEMCVSADVDQREELLTHSL